MRFDDRPGDLKKQKTEARLRKQLKRGTLAVGRNRLATIIASQGGSLQVDAGGLVATVAAPDGDGPFAPGDRVMTRVAALDEATLEATLEYVPVEGLYDDDGEPAESSE